MLEHCDIIVLSGDWNRKNPGSVQRVTEILARHNRILWVSGIPIRPPRLRTGDFKRIADKVRKMLGTPTQTNNHTIPVTEVHPFFIPFYDNVAVRRFNDRLLRSAILGRIQELGFKDYIVLPSNPMAAGVIGTLGESSSHYLCIDDYGANEGTFACLSELEQEILQKVDSSWSMSDVLMKSRIPKSGENHFFPEGVDLDHFKVRGGLPPAALANVKKPIVGYYGLLASWVDYELIVRCAAAYPDVSFVIMGKATTDISILGQRPNIKCLDHVPYEDLPSYAELFDVGLIPRRINRLTVAMNPLKLLEYLAMEMPVISTNLPEVKKFGDLVFVAEDDDRFVRFVGEALKDNTPERRRMRRAHAERFSWQSVAERMSDVIQGIERRKASSRGSRRAPTLVDA